MADSMFSVYRVNYEIEGDKVMNEWTCFIGAANHEEAIQHLVNKIGKPVRVITSGLQCRLDDVTESLRANVVRKYANEFGKRAPESKLEEIAIKESIEKEEKKFKIAKKKL